MEKLGWSCFFLVSLTGPLWALPAASSSEIAYWISAANKDAGLNLKALNGRNLRQSLPRLLSSQVESQPSKSAGAGSNSLTPRETVKEVAKTNVHEGITTRESRTHQDSGWTRASAHWLAEF